MTTAPTPDTMPTSASTGSEIADAVSSAASMLSHAVASTIDPSGAEVGHESEFIFKDLCGVTLRLHGATGLPAADINGKSDPFVTVTIDDQTRNSSTKLKSRDPVWSETMMFALNARPKTMKLQIFDRNRLTPNVLLCECDVDLSALTDTTKDYRLPLKRAHGSGGGGEIHFALNVQTIANVTGRHSKELDAVPLDELISLIDLTVVGVTSLPSQVFTHHNPFAVVSYGDQSYRTATIAHASSPEWNQICPIWTRKATDKFLLKITVFDDSARGNGAPKFLGAVFILPSVLKVNSEHELALPLVDHEIHTDAELEATMRAVSIADASNQTTAKPLTPYLTVKITVKPRDRVESDFYDHIIKSYDSDHDGRINVIELTHLCHTIGAPIKDEEIDKVFAECDKEHTGAVSREQLPAIFHHSLFANRDVMRTLFGVMLHGDNAIQRIMMKDFIFHGPKSGERPAHDPMVDHDTQNTLQLVDRASGVTITEEIPMYIKSAMRLMFRTRLGRESDHFAFVRATLKALTLEQGRVMDNPKSAQTIRAFVKTHGIDVTECEKPISEYKTFNEFFYRKMKAGKRQCDEPDNDNVLVSPADCRLSVWETIDQATSIWVKGEHFTIPTLLGAADDDNGSLSAKFNGGSMVIARLAPQDYHRWHFPVSGVQQKRVPIAGDYFTVNPIAVRTAIDVYTANKRCVCPIQTQQFGLVLLVAVGASCVGSIRFVDDEAHIEHEKKQSRRFDEHGYFAFGGSTVLLLFQPGVVDYDDDLRRNSGKAMETLVRVGNRIGIATGKAKSETK